MNEPPKKKARAITAPVQQVVKFHQSSDRVLIWLFDIADYKLEGDLIGFDEYFNVTLDAAAEVRTDGSRVELGRLMLKNDTIALLQKAPK